MPDYLGNNNGLGLLVSYGNPESTTFPLPGTGKREGGEKTQPFNHFLVSNPVSLYSEV